MSVFQKQINLTGQAGAGTDYPVLLKVGESSGSGANNFYFNTPTATFPTTKNDPGDIVFRDGAGALLSSWVEQVTGAAPNRVAWIWVKVAADLGSDKAIYCVYNLGIAGTSAGANVFEFFDDFDVAAAALDGTKYAYSSGAGGVGISNSEAVMTGVAAFKVTNTVATFADGREVLGRAWPPNTSQSNVGYFGFAGAGGALFRNSWDQLSVSTFQHGSGGVANLNARYQGQYYRMQVRRKAGAATMLIDGTERVNVAAGVSTNALAAAVLCAYDAGSVTKLDWIAVKKYQPSEPAFSSAGLEGIAPNTVLSGNVKDSAGANAARTVRAYRDSTGALVGSTVSNAGTGNFTLNTPYSESHTLVFVPAAGESLNSLVLRGVTPI
jgi:hypothetical protein